MPYKNIHFVKIFLELFDDKRFIKDCSDSQKLDYLLWIAMAGITSNDADADVSWFKTRFNLEKKPEEITENIDQLTKLFTKMKVRRGKLKFDNFTSFHNYIGKPKEEPGNSLGSPRLDKDIEENREEVDKIFSQWWDAYPSPKRNTKKADAFTKFLKNAKTLVEVRRRLTHLVDQKENDRKWLKDFPQYVPNMSTYLNQERWNMDVEKNITRKTIEI